MAGWVRSGSMCEVAGGYGELVVGGDGWRGKLWEGAGGLVR